MSRRPSSARSLHSWPRYFDSHAHGESDSVRPSFLIRTFQFVGTHKAGWSSTWNRYRIPSDQNTQASVSVCKVITRESASDTKGEWTCATRQVAIEQDRSTHLHLENVHVHIVLGNSWCPVDPIDVIAPSQLNAGSFEPRMHCRIVEQSVQRARRRTQVNVIVPGDKSTVPDDT